MTDSPLFYSQRQLAARLGVSRTRLLRWKRAGELPATVSLSGQALWSVAVVEAWIAKLVDPVVGRHYFSSARDRRTKPRASAAQQAARNLNLAHGREQRLARVRVHASESAEGAQAMRVNSVDGGGQR